VAAFPRDLNESRWRSNAIVPLVPLYLELTGGIHARSGIGRGESLAGKESAIVLSSIFS
jgi:hypothetical protein